MNVFQYLENSHPLCQRNRFMLIHTIETECHSEENTKNSQKRKKEKNTRIFAIYIYMYIIVYIDYECYLTRMGER